MDGMDRTNGHFLHLHYFDRDCHDHMANRIPFHRTPGFSADSHHAGRSALYRDFDQRFYLFRMGWMDPLCPLDSASYCCVLDSGRDDLGIVFGLRILDLHLTRFTHKSKLLQYVNIGIKIGMAMWRGMEWGSKGLAFADRDRSQTIGYQP